MQEPREEQQNTKNIIVIAITSSLLLVCMITAICFAYLPAQAPIIAGILFGTLVLAPALVISVSLMQTKVQKRKHKIRVSAPSSHTLKRPTTNNDQFEFYSNC